MIAPMFASLRRAVRHTLYDLQDGFVTQPLSIAAALGLLGVCLPLAELRLPGLHAWLAAWPVLVPRDPATAQALLGTIAGAVMTVVSIVLSVLLVALTLTSMQFSPRILTGFVQDRVNQTTVGVFLGTFLYCLAAYPAVRNGVHMAIPCAAVLIAMALALACVVWLLVFIHHIAQAINASHIADRIAGETEQAIVAVTQPVPAVPLAPDVSAPPTDPTQGVAVIATQSGYIRFIDTERLVTLARARGTSVRVLRRVGQFVPAGTVLVRVPTRREVPPALATDILAAFDIGPTRTLEQDVEFGVLQLVDIALKAISPAVNDPSTAITCIDQLSRVMGRLATRRAIPSALYRPPGTLRVTLPPLSFEHLLETAFGQIRGYGRTDLAVTLRLLRALEDIASMARDPACASAARAQAQRVAAGSDSLGSTDRALVDERLAAFLSRAASTHPA